VIHFAIICFLVAEISVCLLNRVSHTQYTLIDIRRDRQFLKNVRDWTPSIGAKLGRGGHSIADNEKVQKGY